MSLANLNELLTVAIHASELASQEILAVYNSADFGIEIKTDHSPLTIADKRSHAAIEGILKETNLPILSEEGKSTPYEVRKNWKRFWMIDPLDGTKEFIKRNGEFTVNIALIEDQQPILGVVAIPVTGDVYYASANQGAYLKKNKTEMLLPKRKPVTLRENRLRVVASRSHMDDETRKFVSQLSLPNLISAGSSLKFILLASNQADVYPRFAPTMEWDTAAAHAVVNEVGLSVIRTDNNQPLSYNKENLLNPYFICR
jgi:3'(2'), 5'-bisphosphate nucleotidase